jgi:hypothetical protein
MNKQQFNEMTDRVFDGLMEFFRSRGFLIDQIDRKLVLRVEARKKSAYLEIELSELGDRGRLIEYCSEHFEFSEPR